MRKRSVIHFFDCLFWYSLYMLPLIVFVIINRNYGVVSGSSFYSFSMIFTIFSLSVGGTNNPIYRGLTSIFGYNGVLPLFPNGSPIFDLVTWFASCMILHLAVDVLIFLVRWAHSLVSKAGGDK